MISNTPSAERPRERCLEAGAQSLSLRECLALILGSGPPKIGCLGLAQGMLNRAGPGLSDEDSARAFFTALEVSGKTYLSEIAGLGPAGQAKILAAFELGRRYSLFRAGNRMDKKPVSRENSWGQDLLPSVGFQTLAASALQKISIRQRAEPQEWLGFVPIHRSGQMGDLCLVEKGARTHINVDPAELFARILILRPRGIFLFHNHPSGSLSPSEEDQNLTEQVRQLTRQFNVDFLGHWIVTIEGQIEIMRKSI